MKTYSGVRTETGCAVTVTEAGGCRGLDPRFDLRTHSPSGFEWGYGGSGPAQLALALAADVLGDDEAALGVYQRLKFRVVGRLPGGRLDADRGRPGRHPPLARPARRRVTATHTPRKVLPARRDRSRHHDRERLALHHRPLAPTVRGSGVVTPARAGKMAFCITQNCATLSYGR